MSDNKPVEISEYPKDGRLAKYEKELVVLLKAKDNEGIISFSKRIFSDCMEYLKTTLNLSFPNLVLNLINHQDFTELCDTLDIRFGAIPRNRAIIVGYTDSIPQIFVDFEDSFNGTPVEFIANLCTSYIEELIHSADPAKTETQIQEVVCSAIEGFLEIKLPDSGKQERLKYAKKCDEIRRKNKYKNQLNTNP